MAITYECYPFGILVTDDSGDDKEKCTLVSMSDFVSITKPDEDNFISLCDSLCGDCGCNHVEYVFPEDFTYLYVDQKIDSDVFVFSLILPDGSEEEITNDDYGEYVQNQYWFVDWEKVRDLKGDGTYKIKLVSTVSGVTNTETSHEFKLSIFDICTANETTKFVWNQNGSVRDGRVFDNRTYETRIEGYVIEDVPETEDATYETQQYEILSRQKQIKRQYNFVSYQIKEDLKEMIQTNMSIGDKFTVTAYSVNGKNFYQKELYFKEVTELQDIPNSPYYFFTISFTDYRQNLIKRPCKD